MVAPTKTEVAPHPIQRVARRHWLFAAMISLGAAASAFFGLWGIGVALAATAAFLAWSAVVNARNGMAVQLNNTAYERLTRGRVDEAEGFLAQIPPSAEGFGVARAVAAQRALIALHRGELAAAIEHATRAIDRPKQFFSRWYEEQQIAGAYAIRAVAHASAGDARAMEADASRAETDDAALPGGIARAALARAIVLARAKDMTALVALLGGPGARALEWLSPRERALFRALRRMTRARATTAYREPARLDEATEEGRVAAWIEKLAPGAAAFAGAARHAESTEARPAETASAEALQSVERSRAANKKRANPAVAARTLVLWVLLIVMFLAIWQFLSPADTGAPRPASSSAFDAAQFMDWFVPTVAALVTGIVAFQVRSARKLTRRLLRAQRALAVRDDEAATTEVRAMTRSRFPIVAATAHLVLAQTLERKASWAAVITESDAGIGRASFNQTTRAASADLLVPQLVELRALALAATDRPAEADAELAVLARDHSTFAYAARARFRVRLVAAVRAGDGRAAAEVARTRTLDMPLTLRDDVLADIVLAVNDGASDEERDRIEAEVRDDPELRAWLDAITPGLRERVRARGPRVAHAEAEVDEDVEHDAARLSARRYV